MIYKIKYNFKLQIKKYETVFLYWPLKVGLRNQLKEVSFLMTKYSTKFKIKVVKEYLKGNLGYINLAKKYNISNESVVRR